MKSDKHKFLEIKAEIIQATGHPIRLEIIEFLADGEKCVSDIVEHIGAKRSNVSRHLSVMLKAGIVANRKDGLNMIYSLKIPCIKQFLDCINQTLKKRLENHKEILKNWIE